jgi:hypothetical protein
LQEVLGEEHLGLTYSEHLQEVLVEEVLGLTFSELLQEVLVEELVAAVDSLQRYAVSEGLAAVLGSVPAALSRSAIGALGPWRPLLLPLPTPLELLSRYASISVQNDRESPGAAVQVCFHFWLKRQRISWSCCPGMLPLLIKNTENLLESLRFF